MTLPDSPDHDTLPPSMDPRSPGGVLEPPRTWWGVTKQLGPGLIIAGSIVGSGELIATTKTGAQAGIALLWLVVIGCLIKVFVQIELGRYTISHGETTLAALDRVPGPRLRANWIVWFWLAMMLAGVGQLGGIVGGVGQALALSFPIRGDYVDAIRMPAASELEEYLAWDDPLLSEWNLQRFLAQQQNGNPGSADLNDDERAWTRRIVRRTEQRLDRLDETARRELLAKAARLREIETGKPGADIEPVRRQRSRLQEQLDQINAKFFAAIRKGGAPPAFLDENDVQRIKRISPAQQERLFRGHNILSGQLAELDREDHRATEAVFAVVRLNEAEQQLRRAEQRVERMEEEAGMLPAGDADHGRLLEARKQRAFARAEVDHRSRLVDILVEPPTRDDKLWAGLVAVITCVLLYNGRYRLIQNVAIVLVVGFTFITIGNAISLQMTEEFYISPSELARGLSFGLPQPLGDINPLMTALAAFGIIGVGASELIAYPYWCLEKGYAKHTGPRQNSREWYDRALGWLRVMYYDAFASMIVYTIATLAFFLMGVAVLFNEGRDPDGMRMVSTLATAYVPVFGEYARWLFLIGAVAVLYSTYMVAIAGQTRMYTDAFKVFKLMDPHNERHHERSVSALSIILPLLCFAVFYSGINPVQAILIAGTMQALLLPMIGVGALYFRYTRTDDALRPYWWWDVFLIVSCIGLLITGAWGVYSRLV